jgi:phenylalanyl-tRNA synthetase beta chain
VWPTGWGAPERAVDFYDVKADVEALCAGCGELRFEAAAHVALHPGRSARVLLDGVAIGVLGELHPRWMQQYGLNQAPVLFELDAAALQRQALPRPQPVARTPAMLRDLAFVLAADVEAAALLDAVARSVERDSRCAIVRDTVIFDVFALRDDAARKSVALRLTLQGDETLTDAQAEAACAGVVEALRRDLGAELRH